MEKILNFINYLEAPALLNGIIFPNGKIKTLNIDINWEPQVSYCINHGDDTSIKELEEQKELHWNSFAIMVNLIDKDRVIEVIAGEGDYGNDGFLAVINLLSKKLIWLAVFDCSNPFDKLEIDKENIYASSTNGSKWKFNIKEPNNISIS